MMDKKILFAIRDILLKIKREYYLSTREVFVEFLADNGLFFACNYKSIMAFLLEFLSEDISKVTICEGYSCYEVYSEMKVCLMIEKVLVEEYKYI